MNEFVYLMITIIPGLLLMAMLAFGDFDGGDADVGDIDGGWEGPSPFNGKLILGFFCGFGLGGLLCLHYNWFSAHWIAAVVGGFVIYGFVFALLLTLYSQRSNSQPKANSTIGSTATVKAAMTLTTVGEIEVVDPKTGSTLFLRASGIDAKVGEQVKVLKVSGGTATVEKVS